MRAAAPPATATPAPDRPTRWWIVPAVLVGLIVVAWLVVSRMPFGGSDAPPAAPKVDTIAEGTAPAAPPAPAPEQSATIVDVPATRTESEPAETPKVSPPVQTPRPARVPPRVQPQRPAPQPQPPAPAVASEISASDAETLVRNYVTGANYYRIGAECLRVNNRGYKNVGYTLDVWDTCSTGGGSRMLGSWRVDAKTRELFVRRDDGRYLRP